MTSLCRGSAWLFGLLLIAAFGVPAACAQLPQIRLTSVFPAGGQRGTSFDVTVAGGTDLDEASALLFSHPGISAVAKTDAAGKPIASQFVVSVDSATQPGLYDVRVQGLFGISNPRLFRVDTLPEITEQEPNNTAAQAQTIPPNTVVNARAGAAADVDVFAVAMQAGQTLVFRTEAACLDSLMQPAMELFDADNRRVARSRRQLQRDAVLVFKSPVDQTVRLQVHDTVYSGGNDYGYRLAIDTRPQIDAAWPGVLPANQDTTVRLIGRNLPQGQPTGQTLDGVPLQEQQVTVRLRPQQSALGTTSVAAAVDTAVSAAVPGNLISFGVDPAVAGSTVTHEAAPDQLDAAPQLLSVPAVVDGTFAQKSDRDVYRLTLKKGQQWRIDVLAERLGSIADPVLLVNQITSQEDGSEVSKRIAREELGRQNPGGNGLPTLTRDPSYVLTAAADGVYELQLQDRYSASRGSAALRYTLVISPPRPDFRALIFDSLPSADGKAAPASGAISLRKGGTYEVPVYVYRSGGHNDAIVLTADGLPAGVTMNATVIAPGQSTGRVVFQATADVPELVTAVRLQASSGSGDQAITRDVVSTTLVHAGANGLPRTGRVSGELLCAVMKDVQPLHVTPPTVDIAVSQDQQILLPLSLTRAGFNNKVDLAFVGVPKNVDIPKVSFEPDVTSSPARFYVKENAAAGSYNLQIYATAQVPYQRNPWQVERAKAAVAQAVAQLEASRQAVAAAVQTAQREQAEIDRLTAEQKQAAADMEQLQVKAEALRTRLTQQLQQSPQAYAALTKLRSTLPTSADVAGGRDDVAAAVQQITQTSQAVNKALQPIQKLADMLAQLQVQQQQQRQQLREGMLRIEQGKKQMTRRRELIAEAVAQQQEAEARVKATEAAKAATDKAVKDAEAAAKPQNKNVRATSVPVRLTIHPTPGKLTAAVPGGGAVSKGGSIDVGVTIARKNDFKDGVTVQLVLPEGESRVSSGTLTIPADQTTGTLKLTARADAAAGDLPHAVLRATGQFQGRDAGFDLPIALKVTE